MATFTSGYQIKLISDGDESGTWGSSTNQNLERIEQALGSSVQINVESPPTGSTWAPNVMTWITDNAGDAGSPSGKGRARYVEFVATTEIQVPVTVEIRGDTSLIYPDRVYLVKNSINVNPANNAASNLILNVGTTGEDYTVRPGGFALVVVNASTTGIGSGSKTAQSVFNALSDLQIENLIFGNAGAEIIARDSSTNALTIKSTDANSEFLRLDTANNHLYIAGGSAVNTVFSNATTISLANQATDIAVRPSTANALDVQSSGSSLVNLNTITDTLTLSTNNIVLDDTDGTNLTVENNEVTALDVYQSGGANFIRLDTANGTNVGGNRLHLLQNQCDLLVSLGNKLQVATGAAIESYGSALFTTVDINGGTIDSTPIGSGVVSSVRGSSYSLPQANYSTYNGGFVFEDGAGRAGFTKETLSTPVKLRQTGSGLRGFIKSSEMVSATNGTTGYFTDSIPIPVYDPAFGAGRDQRFDFQIAHGFSRPPKTVNWYWEKVNQTNLDPGGAGPRPNFPNPTTPVSSYTTGDRVEIGRTNQGQGYPTNRSSPGQATYSTWKDPLNVGIVMDMGFWDSLSTYWIGLWVIGTKTNNPGAAGLPYMEIINEGFWRNWQLVVEAWE